MTSHAQALDFNLIYPFYQGLLEQMPVGLPSRYDRDALLQVANDCDYLRCAGMPLCWWWTLGDRISLNVNIVKICIALAHSGIPDVVSNLDNYAALLHAALMEEMGNRVTSLGCHVLESEIIEIPPASSAAMARIRQAAHSAGMPISRFLGIATHRVLH